LSVDNAATQPSAARAWHLPECAARRAAPPASTPMRPLPVQWPWKSCWKRVPPGLEDVSRRPRVAGPSTAPTSEKRSYHAGGLWTSTRQSTARSAPVASRRHRACRLTARWRPKARAPPPWRRTAAQPLAQPLNRCGRSRLLDSQTISDVSATHRKWAYFLPPPPGFSFFSLKKGRGVFGRPTMIDSTYSCMS
jgi:hypothetical protein